MPADKIRINDLSLAVLLHGGAVWESKKPELQPIQLSITISFDLTKVAETDVLLDTIDYASFSFEVTKLLSVGCYDSLESLSDSVFDFAFQTHADISEMEIQVVQTKAPIHSKQVGFICSRTKEKSGILERYFVNDLTCPTIIGANACERTERQDVCLNFSVEWSNGRISKDPFDFRGLTRRIYDDVGRTSYQTLEALASSIALNLLQHFTTGANDVVVVRAAKPSALVFAQSAEVEISRKRGDHPNLIGVTPVESLSCTVTPREQDIAPVTSVHTLNSSATDEVAISPHSPSSLLPAHSTSPQYTPSEAFTLSSTMHFAAIALGSNLGDRFANIEFALRLLEGSHLGEEAKVAIIDTSFLYETAPMYVTDQPTFINCACVIKTNLQPRSLLSLLKRIETEVGRVPSIRNGPRAIDLDIITYDFEVIDTRAQGERLHLDNLEGELVVPHPRMAEREFVLRPLNDMIPDFIHPVLKRPIHALLGEGGSSEAWPMKKVIPFPRSPRSPSSRNFPPATAAHWAFPISQTFSRKTFVMATLNVTPDSFSDGSINNSIPAALSYAATSIAGGADIIDIGGYSTRPGAAYVSPEEEISRVVPIIEALRNHAGTSGAGAKLRNTLISVDTFRYDVAKTAVLAGANCINDVHAFTGPEYPLTPASWEHLVQMRQVAREFAVPVILMHSRGDAGSNKDYSSYVSGGILEGIRAELGRKVDVIVKGPGGVRRWLVIVDPGIGFSKTLEDNLQILRNASSLVAPKKPMRNPLHGFPQLIGASKKSFLGIILAQPDSQGTYEGRETEPNERGWATAAVVACAVQQGASVVRVHDTLEMGDVVRVGSLLWG